MMGSGHWRAAMGAMLLFHAYFRPKRPLRSGGALVGRAAAAPARSGGMDPVLHPREGEARSKTGDVDESVL
eukprot:434291-Lingulodinium_polyedra.AAC.1